MKKLDKLLFLGGWLGLSAMFGFNLMAIIFWGVVLLQIYMSYMN